MSRLIWIYTVCKSLLLPPVAVKELKGLLEVVLTDIHHSERIASLIKALIVLVGRLSLSVGWENGLERGLKTVSFNP